MNFQSERKTVKSIETLNYLVRMDMDATGHYSVKAYSKVTNRYFHHIEMATFSIATAAFDLYVIKGQ